MKSASRWLIAGVLLLAGALLLGAVACDDDDGGAGATATQPAEEPTDDAGAQLGTLEITATGDPDGDPYAFEAPATIAGGPTRVVFTNAASTEDHQATFVQLNPGSTAADFFAQAASFVTPQDVEAAGTWVGGPGTAPGGTNENVIDLQPGDYVFLCGIPSPADNVPHFMKGMVGSITVTEPAGEPLEAPEPDVDVTLFDFNFDAPDTLDAGETTFRATNNGPQIHELAFARLSDEITFDEAVDLLSAPPAPTATAVPPGSPTATAAQQGPPPFSLAGQVSLLSNGEEGMVTVDLEPGTYALVCFVPDAETGAPHIALGMSKQLTVE